MLNVLGVVEDLAVDGFQPVGTWAKYFCDDIGPFLGRGEFVVVLVALHKTEDKVSDVEGSTPHPSVVVPSQRLLVLSRTEEGDVAGFI